jgi:hypothetical protein
MNNNNTNNDIHYDFSGKNILVVDDDLSSAIYATKVLRNTGANVTSVNDGEQAKTRISQGNIDLILMDLKLPGKNGIDIMREIRQYNKDIPIIAYTARRSAETRHECLVAGFKDYLLKPVMPDDMRSAIDKHLNPNAYTTSE